MLYIILFLFIDGIYGGFMALLPMFFTYYSDYSFIVAIMPFLYHVFAYSFLNLIGKAEYSPFYFLSAGAILNYYWEYILIFALCGFTVYLVYRKGVYTDVL